MRNLLSSCRVLNRPHHMDLAVMVLAFARRESQVCRETLDPRDRQALRAHPASKDPQDRVETKATMANQEVKAPQVPRELRDPRAQRAQQEPKATQAIKEAKAPQAPRDLRGHWEVTGNSAFGKI